MRKVVVTFPPEPETQRAFRGKFAKQGWVHGTNAEILFIDAGMDLNDQAGAEAKAREILAMGPDAILSHPSVAFAHMMRLTKDIPLVFFQLAFDPVALGLVQSLRRPGANVTGTAHSDELKFVKLWSAVKEILPDLKRVGMIAQPSHIKWYRAFPQAEHMHERMWKAVEDQVGVETILTVLPDDASFARIIHAIEAERFGAVAFVSEFLSVPGVKEFLIKARIPWLGDQNNGGLARPMYDFDELTDQAIGMVGRILHGANPATMPVYISNACEYLLNMQAARALGLTVPRSVQLRAYRVIE